TTLVQSAPSSGVTVNLSSDQPNLLSLPSSVTIVGGQKSATVAATIAPSEQATPVTINVTATLGDKTTSSPLVVIPSHPVLRTLDVAFNKTQLYPGDRVTLTYLFDYWDFSMQS